MAKLLERDVSKQIKDFMRAHGWRAVRTQFAFSPGSFQTGEPGMADWLFLRYADAGMAHALWIEVKSPNDQRRCNCAVGRQCKQCRQKAWHERERALGARVVVVDDFERFAVEYARVYGHLHTGTDARGQLSIEGTL